MDSKLYEHLNALTKIVEDLGEPIEGNCHTYHNSSNQIKENKKINLFNIAQRTKGNIIEIGFNAGHSAAILLYANKNAKLYCFDIGCHKYTDPCYQYLAKEFPGRIEIRYGDSRESLRDYADQIKDDIGLIHVDGGHHADIPFLDLMNSYTILQRVGLEESYIIYDDCYDYFIEGRIQENSKISGVNFGYNLTKNMYTRVKEIKDYKLLSSDPYEHQLFRVKRLKIGVLTKENNSNVKDYCEKNNYDLILDFNIKDHILDYDYIYIYHDKFYDINFMINNNRSLYFINNKLVLVKNDCYSWEYLEKVILNLCVDDILDKEKDDVIINYTFKDEIIVAWTTAKVRIDFINNRVYAPWAVGTVSKYNDFFYKIKLGGLDLCMFISGNKVHVYRYLYGNYFSELYQVYDII